MKAIPGTQNILILSHHHLDLTLEYILEFLSHMLVSHGLVFGFGINQYLKGFQAFMPRFRASGFRNCSPLCVSDILPPIFRRPSFFPP